MGLCSFVHNLHNDLAAKIGASACAARGCGGEDRSGKKCCICMTGSRHGERRGSKRFPCFPFPGEGALENRATAYKPEACDYGQMHGVAKK